MVGCQRALILITDRILEIISSDLIVLTWKWSYWELSWYMTICWSCTLLTWVHSKRKLLAVLLQLSFRIVDFWLNNFNSHCHWWLLLFCLRPKGTCAKRSMRFLLLLINKPSKILSSQSIKVHATLNLHSLWWVIELSWEDLFRIIVCLIW